METLLLSVPKAFIPIFVAIDVFWLAGFFAPLTAELSKERTSRIVKLSMLTAFIVSIGFMALGEILFALLGITAWDFQIAGGLLLLVFAILDLTSPGKARLLGDDEMAGVAPLGVPLIAGPALLTTLMVLSARYGKAPTIIALLINLLLAWVALAWSEKIIGRLGQAFATGMSKIMMILLAAIAVMMIRLGVEGLIGNI